MSLTQSDPPILPHIVLVEDDPDLRDTVVDYFALLDIKIDALESAEALYRHLAVQPVDILLLDLGLPGENGFEVIAHLRQNLTIRIIVISARSDPNDRIRALELGADRYMVKPILLKELSANIDAIIRMLPQVTPNIPKPTATWQLLDHSHSLMAPDQHIIALTFSEYCVLKCLAEAKGICARDDLVIALGKDVDTYDYQTMNVMFSRIRKKVKAQTLEPFSLEAITQNRVNLSVPIIIA